MKLKTMLATLLLAMLPFISFSQKGQLNLIPKPQSVCIGSGKFVINGNTTIKGNSDFAVKYLSDKIKSSSGIDVRESSSALENFIQIDVNSQSGLKERGTGYRLHQNI